MTVLQRRVTDVNGPLHDYSSDVEIVAVAFNEDAARLGQHAARQGYAGLFAEGPSSLARDCNVLQQSSWVAIGRDGAIVSRRGYGANGASFWRGVLDALSAT